MPSQLIPRLSHVLRVLVIWTETEEKMSEDVFEQVPMEPQPPLQRCRQLATPKRMKRPLAAERSGSKAKEV